MGLYTLFLWGYFSTYNIWYNSGHNCRYPISQWYSHDIPIHLPRFSMGFYGFPMGRMTWVTRGRLVPRWRDIESSEQNPKIDAIGQLSDWVCLICVLLFDIWYIYIYINIYNVCIYIYMYAIGHPPIAVVVVMVNFLNWNIHQPTDLCSFLAIVVETIFTLLNSPFPRVDSWVLQRSRLG